MVGNDVVEDVAGDGDGGDPSFFSWSTRLSEWLLL
jgi:hypothetical protein